MTQVKQIAKNEAVQMIGIMFLGLFNTGVVMSLAMWVIG